MCSKKAAARTVVTIQVMRMMTMTITAITFTLIIRVIFFLIQVLALSITANFPLFSGNFNAGACKFDSVVPELIM
jgi:hypothetical protein